MTQPFDFIASAQRTLTLEAKAIERVVSRIDTAFTMACQLILHCRGRIVVMGMGKSGHIANKMAATFASTGTPSFFVHPAEASHGDLGMITHDDIVVALSHSGESNELVAILPIIKRKGSELIAITGQMQSTLAQHADTVLHIDIEQEACPLNLAPTSSTTAALALGDALAIALLEARGFTAEDFAYSHPGGSLGRRLLLRVSDVMHTDTAIPLVNTTDSLRDALLQMTHKGLGMTCVVDEQQRLCGIFTDGDLRRTLDQNLDWHQVHIDQVMHSQVTTVSADRLAAEALYLMEERNITALVIVDTQQRIQGVVHMHDLLKAGVA